MTDPEPSNEVTHIINQATDWIESVKIHKVPIVCEGLGEELS